MYLNLKSITIGKYTLLLQKALTPEEAKQLQALKREEYAASRVRSITSNHQHIAERLQHIAEVEVGRWDGLIFDMKGSEPRAMTRGEMIAGAQESIAQCQRNLAWFAEHPVAA